MVKLICSVLVGLTCLMLPGTALAANTIFSINVTHSSDGTTLSELLFNDQVVWRLKLCSDGVEPVTAVGNDKATVVVPDMVGGLFLLRVYNQ